VEPAAQTDQRPGGAEDVPDPVQQPAPAAQRPGVGKMGDRLLHQPAQPRLSRLNARCPSVSRSMVRRSPTGACQRSRALAMPRNPRSSRLTTSTSSSAPASPASPSSSCSWQLPGQPPSTHSRSPQIVLTARPWAVWVCRLASYSTFWLAHPRGRCTRVASPSTHTASPTSAISARRSPSSSRLLIKAPFGLAQPEVGQRTKQQVQAFTDLGLGDPDRPAGTPVRQPVQQHRSGRAPPCPGRRGGVRWVRRALSQPSTLAGSDERGQYDGTGPDLLAGVRHLPMVWSPSRSGRTEHHGHPRSPVGHLHSIAPQG
jgi:hypothetical protein